MAGDVIDVAFEYRAGASIPSLEASLRAGLAGDEGCSPASGLANAVAATPRPLARAVEFA